MLNIINKIKQKISAFLFYKKEIIINTKSHTELELERFVYNEKLIQTPQGKQHKQHEITSKNIKIKKPEEVDYLKNEKTKIYLVEKIMSNIELLSILYDSLIEYQYIKQAVLTKEMLEHSSSCLRIIKNIKNDKPFFNSIVMHIKNHVNAVDELTREIKKNM